jgi:hypothetical protein
MTSYQYSGKPDDCKAFLPAEEALARVLLRPWSVTAIYLEIKLSLALLFYGYDCTKKLIINQNRWDIWHKTAVMKGRGKVAGAAKDIPKFAINEDITN